MNKKPSTIIKEKIIKKYRHTHGEIPQETIDFINDHGGIQLKAFKEAVFEYLDEQYSQQGETDER